MSWLTLHSGVREGTVLRIPCIKNTGDFLGNKNSYLVFKAPASASIFYEGEIGYRRERKEPSNPQGRLRACRAPADSLLPLLRLSASEAAQKPSPVPNLNPFADSHMELPHLFHSCKTFSCCTSF